MRAQMRKLLIAIPVTLLFTVSAWAQTTAIQGDTKAEDGKPLVGALVKIERLDIKANYKVKTDKKGHYYYGGLPSGSYKVTLEVDGKDVDSVDKVRATLSAPAEVSFDMKKIKERASGAPPPEVERGMSAAEKAEYEKKKKDAEAAMAKNKALNDAFNAGREAETAKNWPVAVEQFQKASELDASQHVVFSHLADAYVNRSDSKTGADKQADLDSGIAAYKKAIELKPDDGAYHNNYALVLGKAKKFEEAQAELTKAAQLDPGKAGQYYYNLGAVYVNTGNNEAAGPAFKKAIEADPNYADAYYQYGITLLGQATVSADGKITPPAGTADALQKYLQLRPDGPNAQQAKDMLSTLGATVETTFKKATPAPAPAPKKK